MATFSRRAGSASGGISDGIESPVLVVADAAAIASAAPAWAAAFAAQGIIHRVVFHRVDVVAAAADFRPRTVVAAGSPESFAVGRAAAAALGVPFVEGAMPGV